MAILCAPSFTSQVITWRAHHYFDIEFSIFSSSGSRRYRRIDSEHFVLSGKRRSAGEKSLFAPTQCYFFVRTDSRFIIMFDFHDGYFVMYSFSAPPFIELRQLTSSNQSVSIFNFFFHFWWTQMLLNRQQKKIIDIWTHQLQQRHHQNWTIYLFCDIFFYGRNGLAQKWTYVWLP